MNSGYILVITGTNRPDSSACRVADLLMNIYQEASISARRYDLSELPMELFHPSAYSSKPPAFVSVQKSVLEACGLHLITPEYNGSFPGVLKYFIDMLKFPESFEHKPVAFIGESNGQFGALRAVEQLQMIFSYRNAHIFPSRVFIPTVKSKFSAEGQWLDEEIKARLVRQAMGFAKFSHAIGATRAGEAS